jgi:hypothetical protein
MLKKNVEDALNKQLNAELYSYTVSPILQSNSHINTDNTINILLEDDFSSQGNWSLTHPIREILNMGRMS